LMLNTLRVLAPITTITGVFVECCANRSIGTNKHTCLMPVKPRGRWHGQ
jgi:hypothetical protein